MGIGSMRGIENISGRQTGGAQPTDAVSKNIQKEISEVQRQKQELSSKRELPAAEKEKERQELQQKISGLNRELRQRQAQNRKEQQRKNLTDESRTDISGEKDTAGKNITAKNISTKDNVGKNTKTNDTKAKDAERTDVQNSAAYSKTRSADTSDKNAEKIAPEKKPQDRNSQSSNLRNRDSRDKVSQLRDFNIPQKEWKAVATSNSSREQMRKQETVIARIEGGIAILKSEIKLDEARGADVEKKQEELKKQEAKLQKASDSSFSSPGQLNQAAEKAVPARPGEATNFSKEKEPAEQQPLFKDITVSLMN